jgi:hypothetical protein
MAENAWYSDMPQDEDQIYEESVRRIRSAVVDQHMPFGKAAELIQVEDAGLRAAILDDALKVLIAEIHFAGGKSLDETTQALGLPRALIEKARIEMLKDVKQAAIEKYKADTGQQGNA